MKTKDEYIEGLAAELEVWSAEIDLLAARKDKAAADMKLKYAEEIDALRAKQHAAAEKMKELKEESGEAWEAVKEAADELWDELRTPAWPPPPNSNEPKKAAPTMNIEIKPALAVAAAGVLILLVSATARSPVRVLPPLPGNGWGEESKRLEEGGGSRRGLYGYRYRGF